MRKKARTSPLHAVDLHAHFPMHLRLVDRVCDNGLEGSFNRALMRVMNRLMNGGAKSVRPKLAERGRVSFASVLYHPADELWGPCSPFTNILGTLEKAEKELPQGWLV